MKLLGAKLLFAAAVVLAGSQSLLAQLPVDPGLPVYAHAEEVKGKITLAGSMTMSQLAAVWAESFKAMNPGAEIQLVSKGSVNAVPMVISGEADFGLLSRPITEAEVKAFHDKFGYMPTVIVPALEQIAIFVNKDNPIESLTLAQLDALFSKSLKRGAAKQATTWADVGVSGKLSNQPVICEGRRDETGLQVFFQYAILGNGEFRADIKENQSNVDMMKAIAANPGAIGFGGATFASPEVKAVKIALRQGEPAADIHDATYPLVRPLQIVINRDPKKPLTPIQQDFIKFVCSQRGQQDVIIGGLVPITARPAQIALEAVGLHTLN
ncbi:PstS family phosphate ABC transporter substrate-binding protein [Planctomicrobium piriforme]|uniref:Phosphate transport system substrate-binding protein n=1 Tax=Planctomicrobium piriforme TaxID=1576369 RepID=A0A1I3D4D0_9PLAN|nr:substrate-binding domain-containing protein [Planctomicrobium piriforme]SFH81468.1 phosphate transport system substrate-binding protein [Planctomicrobium piriforme]